MSFRLRRHRDRQQRGRLQRRLFWTFGVTILLTGAVAGGVVRLLSPELHSYQRDAARIAHFAMSRFARVWDSPTDRHELAAAVAEAFEAGVRLEDASGHVVEQVGPECGFAAHTIDVVRDGQKLGRVTACPRERQGRGYIFIAAFCSVLATLWAMSSLLAHKLSRPLRDLTRVTREIGSGKLESRVRLHPHLPGEFGILAESVNDMAVRIERQIRDQRELLAGVSHEIRSPLARLRVLAELLDGRVAPETIDKIEREIAEIDDLIGNLLASSRLDFGALDTQELVARDVAARALERASLPEALLRPDASGAVFSGDATLVGRALVNLIENAVHHGGGIEEVSVEADDENVVFSICDRGPGLSAEAIARGFDPFFRDSAPNSVPRGSLGLGLALVRRIARAHGGDATIENRPKGGACAMLRIPRRAARPSVPSSAA